MKIDHIRSLLPLQFNKKIRVRVCRIWRPTVIGKDNTFGGLQCILVDEMMQFKPVQKKWIEYVAPKIKANHVYEITRFCTSHHKPSYLVIKYRGFHLKGKYCILMNSTSLLRN